MSTSRGVGDAICRIPIWLNTSRFCCCCGDGLGIRSVKQHNITYHLCSLNCEHMSECNGSPRWDSAPSPADNSAGTDEESLAGTQEEVETQYTWSQYTSLSGHQPTHIDWLHTAQMNGTLQEGAFTESAGESSLSAHFSDHSQQTADLSVENDNNTEEDREQRAVRFASPGSGGSPVRGNGPIPLDDGTDDDDEDNPETDPSASGNA